VARRSNKSIAEILAPQASFTNDNELLEKAGIRTKNGEESYTEIGPCSLL